MPRHPDKRGPSYSWTDSEHDLVCPPYNPALLKSAVINTASLSFSVDDCAYLLDVLEIDIRKVWP